jgi:hypothetical protein
MILDRCIEKFKICGAGTEVTLVCIALNIIVY